MMLPLSILSLSVHEWAHAWSAYKLGDDTASREGRLTLNPLVHIDPLGTILLPLIGIPFGWAKPVPVNPLRFRRDVTMKTGMMITAAAGPLSNLLIAVVAACLTGLLIRFDQLSIGGGGIYMLLQWAIVMNLGLALFNLLPIPPLDGSRVADGLMPYRLRPQWEQVMRYGSILLLVFIVFGRGLLLTPMNAIRTQLDRLADVVAGQ
ncbi:MAG: site-2 protease family protein [Minicystis sp.]